MKAKRQAPTKKNPARNRHWNRILVIELVEQRITPQLQPIRMRAANAFETPRLPFCPQKGTNWREQFIIWPRVVMILLIYFIKLHHDSYHDVTTIIKIIPISSDPNLSKIVFTCSTKTRGSSTMVNPITFHPGN